jgi:hypothetical protein
VRRTDLNGGGLHEAMVLDRNGFMTGPSQTKGDRAEHASRRGDGEDARIATNLCCTCPLSFKFF